MDSFLSLCSPVFPFLRRAFAAGAFAVAAFANSTPGLVAAPTPLNDVIPEGREVLIRCELNKFSKKPVQHGRQAVAYADGEYSYKVWLPTGYSSEPTRRWPAIFIASPTGKASIKPMGNWLRAGGYIVIALQESRNGDDAPCVSNFVAAHDDAVVRLRIAEGLKFATGMSGGARVASNNVQYRPGFAGLWQQAAGFGGATTGIPKRGFTIVTSIGSKDFNFVEYPTINLQAKGLSWTPVFSDAGHSWTPEHVADRAFIILECGAMENATPSPALTAAAKTWLAQHAEAIRKMSSTGDKIEFATRTLKAATRLSLHNTPAMTALASELQAWKKAPGAANDVAAVTAFNKAFVQELRAVTRRGGGVAKTMNDIAKRYPETAGGIRASLFAEACKKPAPMPKE